MKSLLAGGFVSGYRTFALGFLIVLQAVVSWAAGDASMAALIEQLPEILGGFALMAIRAGIANSFTEARREFSNGQVSAKSALPQHSSRFQSHAAATVILAFSMFALVGCVSTPAETARERLLAAETVYAGLVNAAADAIESGMLSPGQIEDLEAGKSLARLALDHVHAILQVDDEIRAVAALSIVAAQLDELANLLETRAHE